jgi:hypothetical protein
MIFPQYRKHTSGKNHYKISNFEHFTEIQRIGTKKLLHKIHAQTHFEKIRIREMLEAILPYVTSTEAEFEALVNG